jgi:L-fucose isomerase
MTTTSTNRPGPAPSLLAIAPFTSLPAAAQRRLEQEASLQRFDEGQILSNAETVGNRVLVLLEGEARLLGQRDGRPFMLERLGPGARRPPYMAHGDLTDTFVTLDIAEAFLNDPYDWEGEHEPIVASTEADMDGAMTMQIFKHITGEPVLFADVRHYDRADDVWYLSNSGTHATYFAGRSRDPKVNLKNVTFYPECSYYPAGGASVHHFAAPGEVTLARLARKDGRYWLAVVPAEFVEFPREMALQKGSTVTPEWPIAFTRFKVGAGDFLSSFPCNHIHGCYGDWTEELRTVGDLLDIKVRVYG